jgi:hypothetical protein
MADNVPLTQQVEKLILANQKKEAQLIINEQLKGANPQDVIAALRAVTDPNVKPLVDRWLLSIEERYAANPTNTRLETQMLAAVNNDAAPPETSTDNAAATTASSSSNPKGQAESSLDANDETSAVSRRKKKAQAAKTEKDVAAVEPTKKDTEAAKAAKDDARPTTESKEESQTAKTSSSSDKQKAETPSSPAVTAEASPASSSNKEAQTAETVQGAAAVEPSKKHSEAAIAAKDVASPPADSKPSKPQRPVPVFDDNDDLSWLLKADSGPRILQKTSKSGGFLKSPAAATFSGNGSSGEQYKNSNTSSSSGSSVPSPSERVKEMIEQRELPAFLLRYWPALVWLLVGFIGASILVSLLFVQNGVTYPLYGVVFIPLAIFRHIRLNAFMGFRTGNLIFNVVLLVLSVFYLYPFREAFNQAKFLIKAYQEWGQGRNLEFRAAKWGRGWNL